MNPNTEEMRFGSKELSEVTNSRLAWQGMHSPFECGADELVRPAILRVFELPHGDKRRIAEPPGQQSRRFAKGPDLMANATSNDTTRI